MYSSFALMQRFAFPSLPQHQKIRRYIHLDHSILIINRQINRRHRIPRRSSSSKPNRLIILRNTIRPQHNRKHPRRSTRTTPRNIYPKRIIPNTIITSKTLPNHRPVPILRIPVRLHPLISSTRIHITSSHPHPTGRRRRSQRRLHPQSPQTAVLPHRSNRITRRINQTQRNRRLRPHHPPPRRKQPRHQQHNQPHPPHRNQAPQKPTHLQPPADRQTPRQAQPAGRPTRIYGLQHIPNATPPPRLIKPSLDNRGASGGADTDAILTHVRLIPEPPTGGGRGNNVSRQPKNRSTQGPPPPNPLIGFLQTSRW